MNEKVKTGVVHGRFQILHNGHVEYILAGKDRCEFLVVGITNPDPTLTAHHSSNPHRSLPSSNPFTYFERAMMTRAALLEVGLGLNEFMIVPLPINRPELIRAYVPSEATFFLTIYDDWGRAKRLTLESLSLRTEVLWDRDVSEKRFNSSEIRRLIALGEPWERMVPQAVAEYIRVNKLDLRIANNQTQTES